MKVTKTDIKKAIREEFQCPMDFIDRLNKFGMIDDLKAAETEHDYQMLKNDALDEYAEYCKAWNLDINADNRKVKFI